MSPGPAECKQWAPQREKLLKMLRVSSRAAASLPNSPTVGKNNSMAIEHVNATGRNRISIYSVGTKVWLIGPVNETLLVCSDCSEPQLYVALDGTSAQ